MIDLLSEEKEEGGGRKEGMHSKREPTI